MTTFPFPDDLQPIGGHQIRHNEIIFKSMQNSEFVFGVHFVFVWCKRERLRDFAS